MSGTEESASKDVAESAQQNGSASTSESTDAGEVSKVTDKLDSVSVSPATDANEDSEPKIVFPDSGLDPKDAESEVIVKQNDPNSPLYSASSFDQLGLKEELLQGVYGMKFNKPSKIQATSLPIILADPPRNLVGQAHNGSGKTACFVLGMLSRIDPTLKAPQALCVCPTRELARQIMDVAERMGKFTSVTYYLAIPHRDPNNPNGPRPRVTVEQQLVVGTPGTVKGLVERRAMNVRNMRIFVLDEADEMIDMQGFADDSVRIKRQLPPTCQSLLFSATFREDVSKFAMKIVKDPVVIEVQREQLSLEGIKQLWIDCAGPTGEDKRFEILNDVYGLLTIGQSIIFVNTRNTAQDLTRRMRAEEHTVSVLHGADMATTERDRIIDDFRTSKTKVLITTNVLSRGIDIPQVTLVINYDMPFNKYGTKPDPETYLHRIGRTGRFGRPGCAISFAYDNKSRRCIEDIKRSYKHDIQQVTTDEIEMLQGYIDKCKQAIPKAALAMLQAQ